MSPKEFIDALTPSAVASSKKTGIPASFTIAEAALESGWGKHAPGMNLFGVKADASWKGPVTEQCTEEEVKGQDIIITAKFRAYTDWQGSMDDHAVFLLTNPRYAKAFKTTNAEEFTRAVDAAGYATDSKYSDKIIAIIRGHGLAALDTPKESA